MLFNLVLDLKPLTYLADLSFRMDRTQHKLVQGTDPNPTPCDRGPMTDLVARILGPAHWIDLHINKYIILFNMLFIMDHFYLFLLLIITSLNFGYSSTLFL